MPEPKQEFFLVNQAARNRAMEAVRTAPEGRKVVISDRTRSDDQNALLHALCGDIARQKEWGGAKRTTVDWKRVFTDGLIRVEEGTGLPMVPSLDYQGVVTLSEPTRYMGVRRMSDLIEFIYSWGAEKGVVFRRHDNGLILPEDERI